MKITLDAKIKELPDDRLCKEPERSVEKEMEALRYYLTEHKQDDGSDKGLMMTPPFVLSYGMPCEKSLYNRVQH